MINEKDTEKELKILWMRRRVISAVTDSFENVVALEKEFKHIKNQDTRLAAQNLLASLKDALFDIENFVNTQNILED